MIKSLDRKLAAIHADANCREFILADAKDADMVLGLGLAGQVSRDACRRGPVQEARGVPRADAADHSSGTGRHHAHVGRLEPCADVSRAALRWFGGHSRGSRNDTTDIHLARGDGYAAQPARPFRTASVDHFQCGHLDCVAEERAPGAGLGLYSVTFNNNLERDMETLEHFQRFREEAEREGFRYFLEVFDSNIPSAVAGDVLPHHINDMITRMLAGVSPSGRPLFLKIVYHGPKAMEELVRFDPHLIVGILGGSSGTTRDAFQLLSDAQKYGARAALFGRKINHAENQLAFLQFLRLIVEGQIGPVDAVKAYHAVLGKLSITPHRSLDIDLKITEQSMSYGSTPAVVAPVPARPVVAPPAAPSMDGGLIAAHAATLSGNGAHAPPFRARRHRSQHPAPARPRRLPSLWRRPELRAFQHPRTAGPTSPR